RSTAGTAWRGPGGAAMVDIIDPTDARGARSEDRRGGICRATPPVDAGPVALGSLLGDVLLPHRCPVCGVAGPSPCGPCRAAVARARVEPPPGVDRFAAVVAYRGSGQAVVAAVKFRGDRGPLP